MAARPFLLTARTLFLLLCGLALFAWLGERSVRQPKGFPAKLARAFAAGPQLVADTAANLFTDPFALSRVPDALSSQPGFTPLTNHTAYRIEGLVRRIGPSAAPAAPGWRILYGIFRIDGEPRYAAIALSPDYAITHVWRVRRRLLDDSTVRIGQAPYPHGLALLPDGSIIAAFDTDYRTVRIDRCDRKLWTSDARLNHALALADDGRSVWGVGPNNDIQQIATADGHILRTVKAEQIARANPDVTALDMLRIDDNDLGDNRRTARPPSWYDPYHINDVEPLSLALAARFPQFRAGDLLVSFRSTNMVAVIDPRSLRIKWLTNNYSFRQHDPDWNADGTISMLDNQMNRGFSRIIAIDPRTNRHWTRVAGKPIGFYSRIRGKHQALPGGGMLITSSNQGRVIDIGRDGKVASDLLARDPAHPGKAFVLSEALFSPTDPLPRSDEPCAP